MPFQLLGLIGRDLKPLLTRLPQAMLVPLPQGFQFIPLNPTVLEELNHGQYDYDPRCSTGSYFLSSRVAARISDLAVVRFGYIEIDCEGGSCRRFAAFFSDNDTVWTGSQIDPDINSILGERTTSKNFTLNATNRMLSLIGVMKMECQDELSAINLHRVPYRGAWVWPTDYQPSGTK